MTEIFLDFQKLELGPETRVAVTLQVNNVANLSNRQSNFTNQFTVPGTRVNRAIFENCQSGASLSSKPYRFARAKIVENGVEIVQDGLAFVDSYESGFKIVIYEGLFNLFEKLGALKINELSWNLLELWSQANVAARLTVDGPFNYLLHDWGGTVDVQMTTPLTLTSRYNYFLPWVKVSEIFKKIVEGAGYTPTGSLFSVPSFIKQYLLAFTEFIPYKQITAKAEISEAEELGTSYIPATNIYNVTPGTWVGRTLVLSNHSEDHFKERGELNGLLEEDLFQEQTVGAFVGPFTHYRVKARGVYKLAVNLRPYFPTLGSSLTPTYQLLPYLVPGVNNPAYSDGMLTDALNLTFFRPFFNNNNLLNTGQNPLGVPKDNEAEGFSFEGYPGDRIIFTILADGYGPGAPPPVQFYKGSYVRLFQIIDSVTTGDDSRVRGGQIIDPVLMLPDITQADFLRAYMQKFCSVPIVNETTKEARFELMDSVLDNLGQARDWTKKIQKGTFAQKFHPGDYSQRNLLKYSYENSRDALRLSGVLEVEDSTLTVSRDIIVLPFRPPDTSFRGASVPLVPFSKVEEVAFPYLTGVTDLTPRVLLADFDLTAEDGSAFRINVSENLGPNTTINSGFVFPFVNRSDREESLDLQKIVLSYYKLLRSMLSKYKAGTVLVDLKPADVYKFDHLLPCYDANSGAYYYVNKIPNFRKGSLSRVELIRI